VNPSRSSLLLLGESDSGKTHFGAQLLRRLSLSAGVLQMDGAATNLQPFESALGALAEGRAAQHTPGTVYVESLWPVKTGTGRQAMLVWPDYGGEQIKKIITDRRFTAIWRDRVIAADSWALMIRLRMTHLADDVFTKPLAGLPQKHAEQRSEIKPSDQARLLELLQMLRHLKTGSGATGIPNLTILLSCWDEMAAGATPEELFKSRLPMFSSFVTTCWPGYKLYGLSALGRPLRKDVVDEEYVAQGPEAFGYVVTRDGARSADLTLPISEIIESI
jgi:Double-GTPase 1